jgi:hypothetical protein
MKTSAEIAAELAAARQEHFEIGGRIKALEARRRELDGGFETGIIGKLERELEVTKRLEADALLPMVRVWCAGKASDYVVRSRTKKCLYLAIAGEEAESRFTITGTCSWGSVDADDLRKLLGVRHD